MRAKLIGGAALSLACPALAQTGSSSGVEAASPAVSPAPGAQAARGGADDRRRDYDAAYFAPFSPATAAEIVAHVPGFTLEQSDTEVRGFSQAAGNVVINGQRPSSKSDTLLTVLQRIPAARVLRVEVGPGDLYGADYASKPQVLNLVLSAAGGLAGTVEAGARRDFTGQVLPLGSASALLRRGRSTFNASATVTDDGTSEEGYDRVVLPDGTQTEYRRKLNRLATPEGAVAGSWAFDGGTNRTAHLNGRAGVDLVRLTQRNDVFPTGGTMRDDRLTERYRQTAFELGGDLTRPLAGGGVKLVGLLTRKHRLNRDLSLNRIGADTIGGASQRLDDRRDETLARLAWNRANLGPWAVEVGGEGVNNRLDSQVDLFQLGPDGVAARVDLPIDHAVVSEWRGEGFINAGRTVTRRLRADLGLTYEASRLTVTGDARAQRTLTFLKPKGTLDWRPGGAWHAQLAVQRTVAQLQFEDFISSAELSSDRVNGGNADLLPQRAWETLVTVDHPVLGDGLIKIEVGYNRIQLVQDRVPTPDGFDAPGNLGAGRVLLVSGNAEAPLGRLGLKGGRLTMSGTYYSSSVTDPYTLRSRPFSGVDALEGQVSLRQDTRRFAWGVSVQGRTEGTYYRLDELDRNTSDFPFVSAFAEWRPSAKTTVALTLDNLAQVPGRRRRTFFEPDRRTRTPSMLEYRVRNQHVIPLLSVKHSFG